MKVRTGTLTTRQKRFLTAAAAGLVATALTAVSDRLLSGLVSEKQKARDRALRKGSAHEIAGPYFAEKIARKEISETGKKRARTVFSIAYSLMWGAIYASVRRKYPRLSRYGGISFAIPFFLACDGMIAPLLGISPNLKKVPWQPSAKEMANHVAWTAAAEMVHRVAKR
ncbi:DUF1440 domain-containing protein [Geomonas sp. RF6]|uniref:DUF1440 domain-containing protein n=1 Tax=Geomonas sp. RF6 TaxID=2897342 RepID=UPI001E4589CA|nr:DUF1440 domain-containing protein [Geomonas sp. RF6]UFS72222.1 DUF1440 domain-containing protein [Geomonas sp. RF6]